MSDLLARLEEDVKAAMRARDQVRRDTLRMSREREAGTGLYGTRGQDVRDPAHGAIPVPTPNEVKADGPAHGLAQTPGGARA